MLGGWCTAVLAVLPIGAACAAESGPGDGPVLAFDVASIKPSVRPDSPFRLKYGSGGTFTATSATLQALVREAYSIEDVQLSGARGWMVSDRFDVNAKAGNAPATVSEEDRRRMLRELLQQRFQLTLVQNRLCQPLFWTGGAARWPEPAA
jgi:uncharacterized protein (TIGR03435 family)